jgi:alkylation response protein AidB-like acyl-CoA dehydrogenase
MSEPHTGSDPAAMTTTGVSAGDGYVINGRKTFCTNGPVADVVLVYAKTDSNRGMIGGITAFLVDADTPGLKKGPADEKMGLRTCTMSELHFDNVRVSSDCVLGPVGAGGQIFLEAMNWERVCLSAVHIGVMQRLLNHAVQFAKTRKAAGKHIGEFQAVAHRLADMKVNLEAGRALTMSAAEKLDSGGNASLAASTAKLFVSETLVKSALDTISTLGGSGFLTENGVERVLRDSVASTIYSGTSDIQRNIIARWLGL